MENLTTEQLELLEKFLGRQNTVDTMSIVVKYNLDIDYKDCDDALFQLYLGIIREIDKRR